MINPDATKERIGYLKLWVGILLASGLSLAGWIIINFIVAQHFLVFIAMGGVCFITVILAILHLKIYSLILVLEQNPWKSL